MTVKITDTTMRDGHQSLLATRRDFRALLIVGGLLVVVAFLPWQHRNVDIRVNDPIPVSYPDRTELQHEISVAENGESTLTGYEVRKATPFGDGFLVAAVGAVAAIVGLIGLTTRRQSRFALTTVAVGALATLIVALYDNFTKNVLNDWSTRDWHVGWGLDSAVTIETEPAFGMFVMLLLAGYLAWRSVSMLIPPGTSRSSERGSNRRRARPQSA